MNKLYFAALLLLFTKLAAQDIGPDLNVLAPPASPAFVLMDITPSNIIVPNNPQAFAIQTISAFAGSSKNGAGNGNYAVEIQPFWYSAPKKMSLFEYNNFKKSDPTNRSHRAYDRHDIFGNIGKQASVSIAFMDGTFDVFDKPQSFISIGFRTRVIEIVKSEYIRNTMELYDNYKKFMISGAVQDLMANATASELLEKLEALDGYLAVRDPLASAINKKPLFAVDLASAYGHFLGDESQNISDGFGRFGVWISTDLAMPLDPGKNKQYIHVYGVFRYLEDGLNMDPDTNKLFSNQVFDYGTKVEIEFSKFSFAFEYISRDGDVTASRKMGSVRYIINDSFAVNGGWGENFMSGDSTISLLGIQWGLDLGNSLDLDKTK